MIFYFSGTGNSLYAAQKVGKICDEKLISISDEIKKGGDYKYKLNDNERIGFVYPIYSWQPPSIVINFVKKLKIENYKNNFVFSISTCSGDEGYATDVLSKELAAKGLKMDSAFTVLMPNNYIVGIDVEPPEESEKKIKGAENYLENIGRIIKARQKEEYRLIKGALPYLKTHIINPLFNKFAINPKKFFVTEDCNSCGLCAKICNTSNIKMGERPVWGNHCVQCFACIHRCPQKAAQYGKGTIKKGRYVNPKCKF